MIEIGIGMPANTIEDVQHSAEVVAKYQFDSFSIYGDLGDLNPFVALQSAAVHLSDVSCVGVMGFPAGLAHPEVIASSARALQEQLGDKLYTGIVRGAFLEKIGLKPASIDQVRQTVEYLRTNTPDNHKIYLGGYGQKILQLAKDLNIDGVKIGGSVNPTIAKGVKQTLQGKDIKIVMGAVCVVDNDRKLARRLARREVSKYLVVVGRLDTTLDNDDKESLTKFTELYEQGNNEAPDAISDSLLDKFALSGTPEDVTRGVMALDGIVDRIELGTPHGVGDRSESLSFIGDTIMKGIRR
jgi:5,10-methylenetetrahydromethanopterin reductase